MHIVSIFAYVLRVVLAHHHTTASFLLFTSKYQAVYFSFYMLIQFITQNFGGFADGK